jgi:nucleolar protein 14
MFGDLLNSEQAKLDLLSATFKLVNSAADMHKGLAAFIELFQPLQMILEGLVLGGYTALEVRIV